MTVYVLTRGHPIIRQRVTGLKGDNQTFVQRLFSTAVYKCYVTGFVYLLWPCLNKVDLVAVSGSGQ